MKKFFLSTLCLLGFWSAMTSTVSAQSKLSNAVNSIHADWLPPFKIGVTGGVNVSNFSHGGYDSKCGFQLGVDAMVDMTQVLNNTYIRTGLQLVRKGAKSNDINYGGYMAGHDYPYNTEWNYRPLYLQLPARFGYGFVLDPNCAFYGEAGPYVALGLGGKVRCTEKYYNGTDEKYSYNFFDHADRFDFGFGFHAGVIICRHHQVSLGYDFGLLNMSDAFAQNRSFMFSYTYFIN